MLQQSNAGSTAGAIFAKARNMYLPDVAEALGFKFKRGQQKFYSNTCPNCGEGRSGGNATSIFQDQNGIWRWNCFCCGKGGTSIDFAALAKGLTDLDAAKYLVDGNIAPVISHVQAKVASQQASEQAAAVAQVIGLIHQKGHSSERKIKEYLESRKIGERVQMEAFRRGQLRMLPSDPHECVVWLQHHVGEGLLRKAGIWKAGSKWPALAFRPLISIFPGATSMECRIARDPANPDEPKSIRYGGMKWPWWWRSESIHSPPDAIMVTEGCIDMWSLVQMGATKHMHLIGIPGTGVWNVAWIQEAAKRNNCHMGIVGVDHDPAGDEVAVGMLTEIRDSGLDSFRILPETKDWNLDLRSGRTTF